FTAFFALTQQAIFLAAALRTRKAGHSVKPLVKSWLITTTAIAVALLPLVGFAHAQFAANQAAGRGFDAPQQAANVEAGHHQPTITSLPTTPPWGGSGYHAARGMAQIPALWPLLMLGALMRLGRRGQTPTRYIVACAILPVLAMTAIGFEKPFLFEARYFSA